MIVTGPYPAVRGNRTRHLVTVKAGNQVVTETFHDEQQARQRAAELRKASRA